MRTVVIDKRGAHITKRRPVLDAIIDSKTLKVVHIDARIEPDYIVAVTEGLQVTNMRKLGSEPDILDHQVVKTDLLGYRSGQKIIGGKCHLSRCEADVVVVVVDPSPGNINLVG